MADRHSLSLVIPTVSRPSLARALASARAQDWEHGDEVLLVGDGPQPAARELWDQFGLPGLYTETPATLGYWGHGARNWVLDRRLARGRYLLALDDDDELAPVAVAIVRRALRETPDWPHVFRMSGAPNVGTVWKVREVREGNVGTPMLCVPNVPEFLGRYTHRYGGDFDFIRACCAPYAGGPVWREDVICRVRPLMDIFGAK